MFGLYDLPIFHRLKMGKHPQEALAMDTFRLTNFAADYNVQSRLSPTVREPISVSFFDGTAHPQV